MAEPTEREFLEGLRREDKFPTCTRCDGTGSIEVPAHGSWEEWGTIYAECPSCHGLGWVEGDAGTERKGR